MTDEPKAPSHKAPTLEIAVMPVTAFQQNCSLLICTKTRKAAIVDPGGEAEKLIEAVEQADATLEQVLLTHGHIDHIGGAADVAAHFGVPIVGPHRADEQLIQGVAAQAAMFGTPGVKVPNIDRWLEAGDTVNVGDLSFDVLFTPGHAPGHVIFVNHAHKFIVMGDVLFQGSIGRTDLPGSDQHLVKFDNSHKKGYLIPPHPRRIQSLRQISFKVWFVRLKGDLSVGNSGRT